MEGSVSLLLLARPRLGFQSRLAHYVLRTWLVGPHNDDSPHIFV